MTVFEKIHPSWKPLWYIFSSSYNFLTETNQYIPKRDKVFDSFSVDMEKIRLIILLPHPLHTTKETYFSKRDIETLNLNAEKLRKQGVLLLRSAFTSSIHQAPHDSEWRDSVKYLIRYISKNNPCTWLLWSEKPSLKTPFRFNISNPINLKHENFRDIYTIPKSPYYNYIIDIHNFDNKANCLKYTNHILISVKNDLPIIW